MCGGGSENASEIGVSARGPCRKSRGLWCRHQPKKGRTESAFPGHQGRFGSAAQCWESPVLAPGKRRAKRAGQRPESLAGSAHGALAPAELNDI